MHKLKPCPFCGSNDFDTSLKHLIGCGNCGAQVSGGEDIPVESCWNKRTSASEHTQDMHSVEYVRTEQPVGLSLECECDEISDGETCLKCGPSPDHSYSAKKTLTADEKENVWRESFKMGKSQ